MACARFHSATLLPLAVAALAACTDTGGPQRTELPGGPQLAASVSSNEGVVFVGAGDIASCSYERDELTARILDTIPGTVFTTGDNAYASGTAAEYAECYTPTWGRHKDRTWPTPGNHEYRTAEGAPYYDYFGARAGPPGLGYYSYELGDWHIVSLNSNIDMSEGSAQERWLRADLAGRADQCVLAYWHEPRFSSGWHGNAAGPIPLWRALYDAGAEIVLNGHDHDYERFAPQTPDGALDQDRGIREFVVGTGGTGLRPWLLVRPHSEARNNEAHGVLKLTLYGDRYDWEFIPIEGTSYTDAGSGTCHGVKPPEGPPATTLDVRIASAADDAEESASGGVALLSTDIELVNDGSNQTVGLRFLGLAIPRGATITTAYVQFQVDEVSTEPAQVTIAGEATDFAPSFRYTTRNISSRPRTGATVTWTLPPWSTVGAAGLGERSPNLAAVLQEIVNRPTWTSGNALALIITGTGRRVAESYDDSPAAALLHVEFESTDVSGVDANRSTVTTNVATLPADGTSDATITVTLLDGSGAPVVGHDVSLSQSGNSTVSAPSGVSDANGQVTFTVTSTTPEIVHYTATVVPTDLTLLQTAQVTFVPAVDVDRSIVATDVGTVRADGTRTATITVTLLDVDGAPVAGHGVSLVQTGSSVISAPSGLSDANGQVTFSVTSTTPETVTYTATDAPSGLTLAQTAQVTFIPPVDAGQSSVSTSHDLVIADGASNAMITVTLRDALGAPVAGHGVSLTQTGSSVISTPSGLSDANGQVTFTVTNTISEAVTYTASDGVTGVTITQTAQVTFKVKTVLNVRIAASPDDAEESAGGIMYLESTDIEMVFDYNDQAVGLRFAVAIPRGATITTAYVQFHTDEMSTDPAAMTIAGEATDHAPPFSWTIRNIRPRPRTSAAVAWAPPSWSVVNEAGPAQRTPDLAAVLQEVVNRPGWTSGNALALIITGTGKRVAHAFNGVPAKAPVLHVEFIN